jgi:hypothetical protein
VFCQVTSVSGQGGARGQRTTRDLIFAICPSGKSNACRANQPIKVQPPLEKYSAFAVGQIISTSSPVSPQEGRLAIVTNAGRDAVDAAASARERGRRAGLWACERFHSAQTNDAEADGEVVWS